MRKRRCPPEAHQGSRQQEIAFLQGMPDLSLLIPSGMPESHAGGRVRFTYTGKHYDREANLLYFNARYYDPDTGRFISQDGFEQKAHDTFSLHPFFATTVR